MNKWKKELSKLSGAVTGWDDIHREENILRTSSLGINSIFGKGWGLPRGFSLLLWGAPRSGKSFISHDMIGQVHKADPDAMVVKFDVEMKAEAQLTPQIAKNFGIDWDRLIVYYVNKPGEVFDRIQNDLVEKIDAGMPLPLIVVDPVSGIQGRRESESESIDNQQRGDEALTLSVGLKRILGPQRHKRMGIVFCAQARVEQDPWKQKKGMKERPAVSLSVLHHCEYWMYVEQNNTKAGALDELGREFTDEGKKDVTDTADKIAARSRVWMQENSLGPKNRSADVTLNLRDGGICNVHEEIWKLAVKWEVIGRPNNLTYTYKDQKWVGKPAVLAALESNPQLQAEIASELHRLDGIPGAIKETTDEEVERAFLGKDATP